MFHRRECKKQTKAFQVYEFVSGMKGLGNELIFLDKMMWRHLLSYFICFVVHSVVISLIPVKSLFETNTAQNIENRKSLAHPSNKKVWVNSVIQPSFIKDAKYVKNSINLPTTVPALLQK